MALDSIRTFTIANGARELNETLHNIGTPLDEIFNDPANVHTEAGDRCAGNVMYKEENYGVVSSGRDQYSDELVDPYEHISLPWRYPYSDVVLDGKEVQQNLGGLKLEAFVNGNPLTEMGEGGRNTLVNMVAPRFRNCRYTLVINNWRDFYAKRKDQQGEGVDGIDLITAPNTEYAGLGYQALGTLKTRSNLLNTRPYLWNPITHDFGSVSITIDHIINFATDLSKMRSDFTMPDMGWKVYILMGTERYNHYAGEGFFQDQRWRTNDMDTNYGPAKRIEDTRTGTVMYADPLMDDNYSRRIFGWVQGAIKKRQQMERSFTEMARQPRMAWNQDVAIFPFEMECNFLCTARWLTGWIEGDI